MPKPGPMKSYLRHCAVSLSPGPFTGFQRGTFGPYGRGPEHLGPQINMNLINTRYSGLSVKPIIKQQEEVEVAENFNFKPKQAVELSCIKNSLKLN